GKMNRLGRTDILWRYNASPGQVNKVWMLSGDTYVGTQNITDPFGANIVVDDLDYVMSGTMNYRCERLLSATNVSGNNIKLTWRYGYGEKVRINRKLPGQS